MKTSRVVRAFLTVKMERHSKGDDALFTISASDLYCLFISVRVSFNDSVWQATSDV